MPVSTSNWHRVSLQSSLAMSSLLPPFTLLIFVFSATNYFPSCTPEDSSADLSGAGGLLVPAEIERAYLNPGVGTHMLAQFRLLGSSLPAEQLPDEVDALAAAVARSILLLHLHVGTCVCRSDCDIGKDHWVCWCAYLLPLGSWHGSHTNFGVYPASGIGSFRCTLALLHALLLLQAQSTMYKLSVACGPKIFCWYVIFLYDRFVLISDGGFFFSRNKLYNYSDTQFLLTGESSSCNLKRI